MSEIAFDGGTMLAGETYRAGDPAPTGYLNWHEWAEVQYKAGLRQKQCGRCSLWRYPQELSDTVDRFAAKTTRGKRVTVLTLVCTECAKRATASR